MSESVTGETDGVPVVTQITEAGDVVEVACASIVNTTNDFCVGHSMVMGVFPTAFPACTTRQQAYRLAAWYVSLAEMLPDEKQAHSFVEILAAIQNT